MGRPDQIPKHPHPIINDNAHPSRRLSPRRRRTGPLDLDAAPLHDGNVPVLGACDSAVQDPTVPVPLLGAVPVLGVRGGLPGLDAQAGERAAAEGEGGVRAVDV